MPQPIKCTSCGFETEIRLTRGTEIKSVCCVKCGRRGTFKRYTDYDKQYWKEKAEATKP